MCVVWVADEGHLFRSPIQEARRQARQETRARRHCSNDAQVVNMSLGEGYMDDRRKQAQIKYHSEQLNRLTRRGLARYEKHLGARILRPILLGY